MTSRQCVHYTHTHTHARDTWYVIHTQLKLESPERLCTPLSASWTMLIHAKVVNQFEAVFCGMCEYVAWKPLELSGENSDKSFFLVTRKSIYRWVKRLHEVFVQGFIVLMLFNHLSRTKGFYGVWTFLYIINLNKTKGIMFWRNWNPLVLLFFFFSDSKNNFFLI